MIHSSTISTVYVRVVLALIAVLGLQIFMQSQIVKADGLIIVDRPVVVEPIRPNPHVRPRPTWMPLHVKNHHVSVTIKNQVATTTIKQVFHNPTNQRLEGTYIFPLPEGAEIDHFEMDVNGVMTKAELLDAKKARKIYEDIVRSMRDPALMEYAGRGIMKVRIFPIEPKSDKYVNITYTQVLENENGLVEYLYPLNTEKWSSRPLQSCSVKVTVESTAALKSIYSPTHRIEVNRKSEATAVVGYEASNVRPDTDFKLIYQEQVKKDQPIGINLMSYHNGSKRGGYFMLMTSPGLANSQKIVEKDIVFVLDTSGSMRGDKLKQAKAALQTCIENLNEGDRFQVVRFSTEAEPLFEQLAKADKATQEKAVKQINEFTPIGGTAIDDALKLAVEFRDEQNKAGRPYYVIFLTDGRPTIGETKENSILKNVTSAIGQDKIRIFNFGIGTEINTHLLDKIAEHTRSFSEYVLPTEDIEVKVSNFYQKISSPVLANLKIKVHGDVKVSEIVPIHMPDLYRGEQLLIFGRYQGEGDAAVVIEGMLNGQQRKIVREVKFRNDQKKNRFIARLWATRRVGYLMNQIRLNGESKELKDEVVRLARQHGIVTPYTAYLIVEDEHRRGVTPVAQTLRPNAPGDRDELRRRFEGQGQKSGQDAVTASNSNRALSEAESANDYAKNQKKDKEFSEMKQRLANNAPASTSHPSSPVVIRSNSTTNGRTVVQRNGVTFYQNGSQWIDHRAQQNLEQKQKAQRVKFLSDEYFALMNKNDEVANQLSLSPNMLIVVEGQLYEIYEASEKGRS